MARGRRRVNNRFYFFVTILIGIVALAVVLLVRNRHAGEITYGSIGAELDASAVIIRDETIVSTENYEKVVFMVVEGEVISDGTQVAQVYRRGYQEESMVSVLNLQKQIFSQQKALLAGGATPELVDVNDRITTVEEQIRGAARGDTTLDMLALEKQLKQLQEERVALLKASVTPDAQLTSLYTELETQQKSISTWTRSIVNSAGTGVVSFYFDGYEQVLNVNKLSTINSALINSVVSGGNTAKTTTAGSETPLYRLITNTHWFLAFVTKNTEPLRLSAGEEYYVTFPDYSDQMYKATARDTVVSEKYIVNILEFYEDIGKLVGVRTVSAKVTKAAQGLVVPLSAIVIENGITGVNIDYGGSPLRVEVDVLAEDGKKAVIRPRNETDTLAVGQKFIKP